MLPQVTEQLRQPPRHKVGDAGPHPIAQNTYEAVSQFRDKPRKPLTDTYRAAMWAEASSRTLKKEHAA